MKKNCCVKTILDAWEKTVLPTISENQRDTWVVQQVLALNLSCSETKNSDLCHISVDEVSCWLLTMLTTRTQTLRLLTLHYLPNKHRDKVQSRLPGTCFRSTVLNPCLRLDS